MTREAREDLIVAMMPFAGILNLYDGDGFGRRASSEDRDRIEEALNSAGLSVRDIRNLHRAVKVALDSGL